MNRLMSLTAMVVNGSLNETARPVVEATAGPNQNASLEETHMAVNANIRTTSPFSIPPLHLERC